jgi:transposase
MLTVDDYGVIRRAHRDGMSIRAIARQFHHSRRNVREALASPEPQPYTRAKEADAPKLGAFKATIDQILADDELAPPKQRHRAMQVFRRLREEHRYAGGYDQVRRYIRGHRQRHEVTFIPLSHDPGQRLELDFGHIYADFPEGRRQVPVLIPTWSFSHYAFAISLPTERIEAILAGMVAAFEFFQCVAREGLVGQSAYGGHRHSAGPGASDERPLRRPGQPLWLRALVLHAPGCHREARCGAQGLQGSEPQRPQRPPAAMLPG